MWVGVGWEPVVDGLVGVGGSHYASARTVWYRIKEPIRSLHFQMGEITKNKQRISFEGAHDHIFDQSLPGQALGSANGKLKARTKEVNSPCAGPRNRSSRPLMISSSAEASASAPSTSQGRQARKCGN